MVGEGILMKVCRKKPKQRAFFLFNDILVYGRVVISGRKVKENQLNFLSIKSSFKSIKYSQQKIIPLREIKIGDCIDTAGRDFNR